MVTENQLPPPLPEEQQVKAASAMNLLRSFASRCKAAGLLIAKQIRRTTLLKVTLPRQYRALGKQLHGEGRYWDEFPSGFQAIDALLNQIKAVEARSANKPMAEGIAAKVKAAINAMLDMIRAKALKMQLGHPLAKLGKATFEKYGEQSGPAELVMPIVNAQACLAALDSNIRQLSESPPGQVFTPKRIAIGGVGGFAVLLVLVVAFMLRVEMPRISSPNSPESASSFDLTVQKLPCGFHGNGIKRVYDALVVSPRNEFETTQQYEARLLASTNKPLFGNLTVNSLFAFATDPIEDHCSYDADSQELSVETDLRAVRTDSFGREDANTHAMRVTTIKERGAYVGQNAFGAKADIEKVREARYEVIFNNPQDFGFRLRKSLTRVKVSLTHVDADTAREAKPNLRKLLLCRLVSPFTKGPYCVLDSIVSPTIQSPLDSESCVSYINVKVEEIWFYNSTTGDIYARFGPDTGRKQ